MFERNTAGERAILVQPVFSKQPAQEDSLEFAELASSAGAQILSTLFARMESISPKYLLGTGKVAEIKEQCTTLSADLVLINHALSPVQERNLEQFLGCRVVDRSGLILDIFAKRARSHEGQLQVELAQLKHIATRLVRGWTHLERQRGGSIGLRGPGETQLETDRRLLAERVKILERRLEKVLVQRTQTRRARMQGDSMTVALVGYTNAGKSTLFNAMTDATVYAQDQLFATLDPTIRRLLQFKPHTVLLADTVGFIKNLPHELIAAFRSTLSEVCDADLLLHIVDASDPMRDERIEQVNAVLSEIDADEIPQIQVWNKIDQLENTIPTQDYVDAGHVPRVFVSAQEKQGLQLLQDAIQKALFNDWIQQIIELPTTAGELRAKLYAAGIVQSETSNEQGFSLSVYTSQAKINRILQS